MFLSNGLASQEFLNLAKEGSIILDNPLILVFDSPITHLEQIIRVIEYCKSLDRPLVLFSPEIKESPLSILLYNMRKENLRVNMT